MEIEPLTCTTSLKAKENHVDTSSINYKSIELLKFVVPGLQRLGSALMNITGAISFTNYTHLEVTKYNHSMPKLTYLGPL